MSSAKDDFRRLIKTFKPSSQEYWQDVGRSLFGATREEHERKAQAALGVIGLFFSWLWSLFLSHLLPIVGCFWFERRLRPAIEQGKQDYEIPEHAKGYLDLSKDELKDSLKIEIARKEQFNRKAQAYLMGVTLASSFVIGVLGVYAKSGGSSLPFELKVVLLCLVFSLVMSAASALRVIAPSEAFDLYLQARHVLTDDDKSELEKKQLLKLTLLNQGHNLIAVTYLTASFRGMRNGLILVTGVLAWAIIVF